MKLNCDGAYKQSDKSGGWGFVIRGADGGVTSSGYGMLSNVGEAFHAELCACLQAVQRAADLGIQRVILATNASMVVQAVTSPEIDRSSASGLIWELKNLSI
jgi:ribonuclease HI